MTHSVNPNAVSICSEGFVFLINPNEDKKNIYVAIVSNILEFPFKGILSANQVCADGHFCDNNPRKLLGKQLMVTRDGRGNYMFISDGLVYLPIRCPTNE